MKKCPSKIIIILTLMLLLTTIFLTIYTYKKTNLNRISKTLKILNWEDYTGTPELLKKFEKTYNLTIEIETYKDENEILKLNISNYDLILMSDTLLNKFIKSEKLEKLNPKIIKNLNKLSSECQLKTPNSQYFAPYILGTTGIIVNENYISDHQESWDILWDSRYSNKVIMLNNIEELVMATSLNTNSKLFPETQVEFNNIKNYLKFQQKSIVGYSENLSYIRNLFENKTIWAAHAYIDVYQKIKDIDGLIFYIPKEGGIIWLDGFVIPKNAKNKYTSELFLNFLLETQNNLELAKHYKVITCNKEVKNLLPKEILTDTTIFLKNNSKKRLFNQGDEILNQKFEPQLIKLWNELKK